MHRDRNNGTWPELKAKRNHKYDNAPSESIDLTHTHLDGEAHDNQKVKKDRTAKQYSQVQNMFKDMADYVDKKD